MATMGSLVADMRLNSAAFRQDLGKVTRAINSQTAQQRQAMRRVEQASRRLGRQFSQLRGAAVALAGALAVRQFTKFTTAAIENADSLAKQSKQLQISAEAFQRLRIEGDLAGVATEKMESGIGQLVKRIGEAQAGTGSLVEILRRLNPELLKQVTAATSTEEAMDMMLAGINNASSAFQKQALSAAAFGRQAGQAMVLLAEDIGKLSEEQVRLQTISDGTLKKAEELNDQLANLRGAFSAGFDTKIIEGLSGSVNDSAEVMREARRIGEEFGHAVGAAMLSVAKAARFVADNMRLIGTAIATLIALKAASFFVGLSLAILNFATTTLAAARATNVLNAVLSRSVLGVVAKLAITLGAAALTWQAFGDEAKATAVSIELATKKLFGNMTSGADAATTALDKTSFSLAQQFSIARSLRLATEQGAEAVHRHNIALETQKALIDAELIPATQTLIETQKLLSETSDSRIKSIFAIVEATEGQRRAVESLTEAEGLLQSVQTPFEERIELQQRLNELVEQGALTQSQATMIWLRTLDRTKSALSDVGDEVKRANDFARDMGLTMSLAFEDAIAGGKGFSEVLRSLEQDILRILTRSIITQPAGNLFQKFIGQAVGSLGALLGGGGAAMTPSGFVQGGGSAFAQGGSFTVGGGGGTDSQPVRFMATPGERVTIETPAQQSRGGVNVIINNYSSAEVRTRESSSGGGVSLEITLDDAMARQVRRPGSQTSRALIDTFGAQRALALR